MRHAFLWQMRLLKTPVPGLRRQMLEELEQLARSSPCMSCGRCRKAL